MLNVRESTPFVGATAGRVTAEWYLMNSSLMQTGGVETIVRLVTNNALNQCFLIHKDRGAKLKSEAVSPSQVYEFRIRKESPKTAIFVRATNNLKRQNGGSFWGIGSWLLGCITFCGCFNVDPNARHEIRLTLTLFLTK